MKDKSKLVKALAIGGTAAGLIVGGLGGALLFPKEVINVVEVPYEVQVEIEKIVNQTIEVPVEIIKEVEVEKIVEVDNGNLDLVLDYIYSGNVTLITEDLDEDEVDQVVDRIIFLNDIEAVAEQYVKDNIKEEVDRERVGGIRLYEELIDRLRLDKDVIVEDIDFKYNDATVKLTGSFRQDKDWFNYEAEVIFVNGEVDDFKVEVTRD
jgi:hypothetical protein